MVTLVESQPIAVWMTGVGRLRTSAKLDASNEVPFVSAFGREETEDGTALAERQIQARLDDAATRLPSEIDDAHVGSSSFGFGGRDHGFNREL